jgi:hypothetical protein
MKLFDFASIRRSVAGVGQKLQQMQTEVEDLRRQREQMLNGPASKEDMKAMLAAWLESTGDKYRQELQETLKKFVRNPRNMTSHNLEGVMSITGAAQPFSDAIRNRDVDQALCALFGPMLKKALMEEVDRMEWAPNALTIAERTVAAERLSVRISQLQEEIREMISAAEEAGITWNR